MKNLTVIFAFALFSGIAFSQDTSPVDNYKVAFYSKEASGVFKEMKGTVVTAGDDSTAPSSFDLSIDVASINTGNGIQNKHAKSADWFHAEKFPNIDFKSSEIIKNEKGTFAKGILMIYGIGKEVTLPLTITSNDTHHVFKTKFSVNRLDYNMGPKSKVSTSIKIIAAITIKK